MKSKSAIGKGKLLERYIEREFRHSGIDIESHRNIGSGSGEIKGDVIVPKFNFSIECKNTKKCPISSWHQTKRAAKKNEAVPVLVWHPQFKPLESSVVMIRWVDLKPLLILAVKKTGKQVHQL